MFGRQISNLAGHRSSLQAVQTNHFVVRQTLFRRDQVVHQWLHRLGKSLLVKVFKFPRRKGFVSCKESLLPFGVIFMGNALAQLEIFKSIQLVD